MKTIQPPTTLQPWPTEIPCKWKPDLPYLETFQLNPNQPPIAFRLSLQKLDLLTRHATTSFNQKLLFDTTPLPDRIPAVKEIGSSSAPLMSASFFIGARCHDYNDDYMQCKNENPGRGEFECMKEGRKVTRCAQGVLQDINTYCLIEFRKHWECLEQHNQQLFQCRPQEWTLNKCVYDTMKLVKEVPDQPKNSTPVHLRSQQIYAHSKIPSVLKPFAPPSTKEDNEKASQ
ncbi:hypothetical protein MKZ38_008037 [Zalerion maritima]|uniref:NADH dehydrogenase [ubiquinone] 1 alpha subcomplex subunit 8 n=1 Tax=Zalerion maritima TaxID=339359 RepID=A0AAD5RHZ7_9PEZI|nr:hypothetical protein MKZ38_008037 [Zalerion maritima]